jgi:zinc and cadmium transporter
MTESHIWVNTLLSVGFVSLLSLIGIFALALRPDKLRRILFALVSLAVGALFGDAFIHLLPEAFGHKEYVTWASLWTLVGFFMFFVLENFVDWRHEHAEPHGEIRPVGYLSLTASSVHNFIDGLLIGVSYRVSVPMGLATTLAIVLHEIPHEIGDFAILVHAGFKPTKALMLNLFTALTAVVGAVTALSMGFDTEQLSHALLPLAAGGFIYIAGTDLMPEMMKDKDHKRSLIQLACITLGVGLMFLVKLLD